MSSGPDMNTQAPVLPSPLFCRCSALVHVGCDGWSYLEGWVKSDSDERSFVLKVENFSSLSDQKRKRQTCHARCTIDAQR